MATTTTPGWGTLASNKILLSAGNTNTAGAYTQTMNVAATSAGNLIPAGLWWVTATANVVIQANNGIGFLNVAVANAGGLVMSDGINWQLLGFGTNTANLVLYGANFGYPSTDTFTSF